MKIVVLDSYCVHEGDLNWQPLYELTQDITLYPRTPQQQTAARIGDADYVIGNKCIVDEALLAQCPNLKWIGLTATGTDRVDLEACRRRGVAVANVPGYSTYSVAQHTFALLLEITNGTSRRAASLRDGYWQTDIPAKYGIQPHQELHGMTFGIVGYGDIGRAAAKIAQGFGMEVLVYTRTPRPQEPGVRFVDWPQLLKQSDVVSLHCPATPETRGMVDAQALAAMKPGAILLNTARGQLVDEQAVVQALASGQLGWYGADVLCCEPAQPGEPLCAQPHALLTPHVAWATTSALNRLAQEVCENLRAFSQGTPRNLVT